MKPTDTARTLLGGKAVFLAGGMGILVAAAILLVRLADSDAPLAPRAEAEDVLAHGQNDIANWVGPMGSLEQLTAAAEVVAVGKFAAIKGTHDVLPDGYDRKDNPDDNSSAVTFTLLVFKVERYIKGDGPGELIVRQTGDLARGVAPDAFPAPDPDQETLVFLVTDAFGDGTYASVNGPWGRMIEKDGRLRYVAGFRSEIEFLSVATIDDAIDRIEPIVAASP